MSNNNGDLVNYKEGDLSAERLNAVISEAWLDIRSDPAARSLISERLGLDPEFFEIKDAPFAAEVRTSGFDGGLVAIFVAKAVAGGVLAKLGGEGYEILKKLWVDYFKRKVSPPGSNNVGDQVDD